MIERAYRGISARRGWTHEADLVSGARTDAATLTAVIADPASRLLIAWRERQALGCVHIADRGEGFCYLGLFCIEPDLQGAGLGNRLIAEAESQARRLFNSTHIEMTVIDQRVELIEWYRRLGYLPTGETRPFPIALNPPLVLAILEKPLS